jgi:uncharacterized protein
MGILVYLGVGLLAGVFAGFFGLGGGVVLIPLLIYIFEMTQKEAQGTSLLALIPPVGLLAALQYIHSGAINLKDKPYITYALLISLGLFLGGFFGAKLVAYVKPLLLRQLFGCLVVFVGLRMILEPFFNKTHTP